MKDLAPFKMLPSRHAQARRPGGRPGGLSGRASFVWLYGVLLPIADGETDVEIRRRSPDGPWHLVRMSAQRALDEIQHYEIQRASLTRGVQARRARKGRPPLEVRRPS